MNSSYALWWYRVIYVALLTFFFKNAWKANRGKVLDTVENVIDELLGRAGSEQREVQHCLAAVSKNCYQLLRSGGCGRQVEYDRFQAKRVLITLDDNFFYESMRYEYFKLAKQRTLSARDGDVIIS